MVAKIIAMGLIWTKPNPADGIGGSYLRDPWNWLDFVVVIVAFLAYIPGVGNFSGLKNSTYPSPIKDNDCYSRNENYYRSLLASMGDMVSVIILAGALFTLFGILGVQLFVGVLESMLYLDQDAITPETGGWTLDDFQGGLCGLDVYPETSFGADCRYEGFVATNLGAVSASASYTAENPLVTTWDSKCRPSIHTKTFGRTCDSRVWKQYMDGRSWYYEMLTKWKSKLWMVKF